MPAPAVSTPLARSLCARIRASGPITYAEWMGAALYDARHGYYRRGRPTVGPEGDFLTSPEVHPIFGAAVGEVALGVHEALGRPQPLQIVEVGPGTGALAESLLAALAIPVSLTLVEPDARARERQRERLASFGGRVEWRESVADAALRTHMAPGAQLVIANELLDAQPVHRLRFEGGRWRELLVECSPQGAFRDRLSDVSDPALLAPLRDAQPREGQIAEVSPMRAELVGALAGLVDRGLLLLVDYGYPRRELYDARRRDGTLMTFRGHVPGEDPYARPGEQDITCHIDIDQVREAAVRAGLMWRPAQHQGDWLAGLGAALREQVEEPAERLAARRALEALSDPEGLGRIAVMAAARGPIGDLPGLPLEAEGAL